MYLDLVTLFILHIIMQLMVLELWHRGVQEVLSIYIKLAENQYAFRALYSNMLKGAVQ